MILLLSSILISVMNMDVTVAALHSSSDWSMDLRSRSRSTSIEDDNTFIDLFSPFERQLAPCGKVDSFTQVGPSITGLAAYHKFGHALAVNDAGNIIAASSPFADGDTSTNANFAGLVRILKFDSSGGEDGEGDWVQLGQSLYGNATDDQFGFAGISLSASGYTVAIGSHLHEGEAGVRAGHVLVYQYDSGEEMWIQLGQDLDGENAGDRQGFSVDLSEDGMTVAVGAILFDEGADNNVGRVAVYEYNETISSWQQLGNNITGEDAFDESGYSVSISNNGHIVATGAPKNKGEFGLAGHARVFAFQEDSDMWVQLGQDLDGERSGEFSAASIGLSGEGDVVVIGSKWNSDFGVRAGHARAYKYDGSTDHWEQLGQDIMGITLREEAGFAVAISDTGNILALSSPEYVDDSQSVPQLQHVGLVRLFQYDEDEKEWIELGAAGDPLYGDKREDKAGYDIALSANGRVVVISAPSNDDVDTDAGQVKVFSLCIKSPDTDTPTDSPTLSLAPSLPIDCDEDPKSEIIENLKVKLNGEIKTIETGTCQSLSEKSSKYIRKVCNAGYTYDGYEDPPHKACPITCKIDKCATSSPIFVPTQTPSIPSTPAPEPLVIQCNEDPDNLFVTAIKVKDDGTEKVFTETCKRLSKRNDQRIEQYCESGLRKEGIALSALEMCPFVCGYCTNAPTTPAPTTLTPPPVPCSEDPKEKFVLKIKFEEGREKPKLLEKETCRKLAKRGPKRRTAICESDLKFRNIRSARAACPVTCQERGCS